MRQHVLFLLLSASLLVISNAQSRQKLPMNTTSLVVEISSGTLWSLSLNESTSFSPPPSLTELNEFLVLFHIQDLTYPHLYYRRTVVTARQFYISLHHERYEIRCDGPS